jgi:2-polyprenyl-3-methyl-5-hydroxy-6-metoxy-1,4-benzoquinol methylase
LEKEEGGKHMNCRLCNAELKHVFVDLGYSPAANSFLSNLDEPEVWYPLKVMVCHECFLVQMDEYKKATEIFNEDYPYYSSHSPNNVSRAKDYAEMMMKRFNPKSVLEIGSNDGYLLQWFKEKGCEIQGVDPAQGAAMIARRKGIPTDIVFFDMHWRDNWARGEYDLICGSNVLAHQPNLNDFLEGVRIVLKDDGVCTFEFPTVVNLLNGSCQFDTIYHEHNSYLSFIVVCNMFRKHGLKVFDVLHTPEQGGSIMVFAQHESGRQPVKERVDMLVAQENEFGITDIERYKDFQHRVDSTKNNFLSFLLARKARKEIVVAYGSSCKCSTFFNYAGVRPDLVPFVVDISPLKQGKYMPGSHIPIVSEEELKRVKPRYVVITAWNLRSEIVEQLEYIRSWNGKFVITTPYLEVF